MKKRAFATLIGLLLLLTPACKKADPQTAQPAPTPDAAQAAQDTAAKPEANAPEAQPAAAADPAANAQPQAIPGEYVDIADACRPGMTDSLSAQDWAKANNAFGIKLLQQTKGNAVFSPYSIERAMGMMLDGACQTTATEMLSALAMPNAKRLSLSGLEVDDALRSVTGTTLLEIENTLWPDTSLALPADYLARIGAGYKSTITSMNYSADAEKARQSINDAIDQATHGKIKDLLPGGSITGDTKLVLTNSVYFKSDWTTRFPKDLTNAGDFYNSDKPIQTKIMHRVDYTGNVCIGKDFSYYDLRFHSSDDDTKGAYIMRIVLPTLDSMDARMEKLDAVEKQLADDYTKNCTMTTRDVVISLPKFTLKPDSQSMKDLLIAMGMNKAFSDSAEFFAMPENAAPGNPVSYLKLSDVFQKAFIDVNELGTEAAAAMAAVAENAAIVVDPAQRYDFTVDHPFVFMILEQSTGAALFMGRVTDL